MLLLSHAIVILFAVILCASRADDACHGGKFKKRCGECWCAYGNEPNETCPVFTEGHNDEFAKAIYEKYLSFNLINSDKAPKLEAKGGGACFPFTHLGEINKYPDSKNPQCEPPSMSDVDGAVCAFRYKGKVTNETCSGRDYEMNTYESLEAAEAAGAKLTHTGACGVCSSAKDLGVDMKKLKTMAKESAACAAIYFVGLIVANTEAKQKDEFQGLVDCFENMGFTRDCATLWAHSSATDALLCTNECQKANENPNDPLNGPSPTCPPLDCIACTEGKKGNQRELHAGRTGRWSGIVSDIVRPCEDFSEVIHDPCDGTLGCVKVEDEPTQAPTSRGRLRHMLDANLLVAGTVSVFMGLYTSFA